MILSGNESAGRPSTGLGSAFDSFTYSPDGRNGSNGTPRTSTGTPLQDFLRSQQTSQMVRYQKIADEQMKKMRDTQVELDQEKTETLYLRKEVEKLQIERDKLKRSLEDARQNLFRQKNSSFDERYDILGLKKEAG